jgi:AAA domain, putative AbiEii toxin, Type IV TA system
MYIGPFRNAINVGAGDYFDIRIGDAFIAQLHDLKSGPSPQANEAIYRMTRELQRIFGFDELEINPTREGTLQLNIDGFSYRSSEIGAGFAHFLLVAANVLTRQPTLLLIDEPELNLHPALQLDFLLLLGSYAPGGVVFATHSLGLARAGAERVYCVTRDMGVSQLTSYEETPGLAALTGQLGFGGRTDLQFEGVLLVEGVTDVKVFQQLLRRYGKEHQYVIVPLAGTALINANAGNELAELRRLADRIFAVIDSERAHADAPLAANRAQFAAICKDLSIPCTVLQRRAIENYFPEHAVQATYGPQGRGLGPYELAKEAGFGWNKARNWRVAREMRKDDLQDSDLAELLERL